MSSTRTVRKAVRSFIVPSRVNHWEEYFLWMAWIVSIKSKDPKCPVGAVITSQDHVVLSTGFNGFARGVFDDEKILAKASEKIKIVCHAEFNAIMNAARIGVSLQGASIFVTKFPCLACCNAIIQSGIKTIYTHDDSFWRSDPLDKNHSRKQKVLQQAGIVVNAPHHPNFRAPEQINPRKKKPPMREPLATSRVRSISRAQTPTARVDPRKKKPPMRVSLAEVGRRARSAHH